MATFLGPFSGKRHQIQRPTVFARRKFGLGGVTRGWALAQQGQLQGGLAELKRNLEAYDPDGRKSFTANARTALAEVYFKAGDTVSALQAVDAAWLAAE